MPDGRTYNAGHLEELTQSMLERGSLVVDAPGAPELPYVHQPDFEHHPSRIEAASTAIAGLARVFTTSGRAEIAASRAATHQSRIDSAKFVDERLLDTRASMVKPTPADSPPRWVGGKDPEAGALISWVQTDRRGGKPPRPEERSNRGKSLMDHKNIDNQFPGHPDYTPPAPNLLRPTTRAERRASWGMERKFQRLTTKRRNARWLAGSYERDSLDRSGSHKLSRSERRQASKTSRKIEKLENGTLLRRGAQDLERSIHKTGDSSDVRGTVRRKLAKRAGNRAETLEQKVAVKNAMRARRARRHTP